MNSCRDGCLLNIPFICADTTVSFFELPRNWLLIGYLSFDLWLRISWSKTFANTCNILLIIRNSQRHHAVGFFECFYLDIIVISRAILPLEAPFEELGIVFCCVTRFRFTFVDWRQVASLRDFILAVFWDKIWNLMTKQRVLARFQMVWQILQFSQYFIITKRINLFFN